MRSMVDICVTRHKAKLQRQSERGELFHKKHEIIYTYVEIAEINIVFADRELCLDDVDIARLCGLRLCPDK